MHVPAGVIGGGLIQSTCGHCAHVIPGCTFKHCAVLPVKNRPCANAPGALGYEQRHHSQCHQRHCHPCLQCHCHQYQECHRHQCHQCQEFHCLQRQPCDSLSF